MSVVRVSGVRDEKCIVCVGGGKRGKVDRLVGLFVFFLSCLRPSVCVCVGFLCEFLEERERRRGAGSSLSPSFWFV
jgi:hypothetical protein